MKCLNQEGVKYLWSRIKATFATQDELSSKASAIISGLTTTIESKASYSEGTWTPSNTMGAPDTSAYKFKDSKYRKIGNVVILTTTATPTNAEAKNGTVIIAVNTIPFALEKTVSTFSINRNGMTSMGVFTNYGRYYNFGQYSFVGNSGGLSDVDIAIIYSL